MSDPGTGTGPEGPLGAAAGPEDGGRNLDEGAGPTRPRAEGAKKHRQRATAARRRRIGWRGPLATLLIVVGCVLAPLSVIGVWTANQVSDTSRYVGNVAPLISEPSIQRALTDKITAEITAQLDVKGLTNQAAATLTQQGLTRAGDLLAATSGSIASAVNGFIHDQVAKIVASPQAAKLWTQLNRAAHAQVVKILSGQGAAITVVNGQATLNLAPLIDTVKKDLSAKGFTLVNKIPPISATFPLFSAKVLVKAQNAYRLLNTLKIVLPILALVLLALGVYVARSHRRALIGAGLGVAASMLVLGAALAIVRSIYLGSVPNDVLPGGAAAALFDTLVRFIKTGLRALLVVGLIVAIGAFFTGPSVTAVRTRGAFTAGLGWVRGRGERAGLRTGPLGRWTYAHRTALRIGAVALAALIFVFWSQPTGIVALVIAIVLLIVLGLIELIGRPPANAPGHHAQG
ncbi:MAG: hypothetical protein ACM3ML_24855 [Micromonosporaceae bacterium]